MNHLELNRAVWDARAARNDRWSQPVGAEEIAAARRGRWSIVLTPRKPVPRSWFPETMSGVRTLCLAGGGGQQGPILAAAGAEVTVLDNSPGQLGKDRLVAEREGLRITTVQGNMQDLSAFEDSSFDLIVHPWSNGFVDDVRPVWRECARVLRKGGTLLAGFGNPVELLFDAVKLAQGEFRVANHIPYADLEHQDDEALMAICRREGYIWAHTLEDQLGGQMAADLAVTGLYEDVGGTALDNYMYSSMATRAIKL